LNPFASIVNGGVHLARAVPLGCDPTAAAVGTEPAGLRALSGRVELRGRAGAEASERGALDASIAGGGSATSVTATLLFSLSCSDKVWLTYPSASTSKECGLLSRGKRPFEGLPGRRSPSSVNVAVVGEAAILTSTVAAAGGSVGSAFVRAKNK
jgi:hypothetical protein